jgi:anti-sigma factor RsiW
MSAVEHDQAQLGAYVLGALEADEVAEFEAHLAWCAACRQEVADLYEVRDELDEVPPEAFLDGPPEGGELLLQRTLRAVREAESQRRPRSFAVGGAAAVIVVTLGVGIFLGRQTAPDTSARLQPVTSAPYAPPSGARNIEGSNAETGARLAATVTPAAGWVRVHVAVQGVREGERCKVVVVSKQGQQVEAGSWVVSAEGEREGVGIDGAALVPPNDVAAVEVVALNGRTLVSAQV